jgi:hypothetical protein
MRRSHAAAVATEIDPPQAPTPAAGFAEARLLIHSEGERVMRVASDEARQDVSFVIFRTSYPPSLQSRLKLTH